MPHTLLPIPPQDWEEGDGDYVAPELLQAGGEPSERADIFSLGASLYECATGAPWLELGPGRGWPARQ
jgi:serine/threonine protein kinase